METTENGNGTNKNINAGNVFTEAENREARKIILKGISKKVKEGFQQPGETVNEALLRAYKARAEKETGEKVEFKSFSKWREEGKKIIKGAKAFWVWSRLQKGIKKDEKGEEVEQYEYFGLAKLFSSLQVQ